ncbi:MAG: 30S ribosomal protein S5 [Lachnospiraceae bacterium]|jgi:SSU ribosomal protein S5P|nr:30S ribosomal protein S5 [Lachnospiraceae bacterium]MBQ6637434.1 30S ribosomal protein S5 [Lachnospiraceae bacterium]MBR3638253.1 30S ribosomal protein S5 [Lachnospiraceae bacterium]
MQRNIIDPSELGELQDKVVTIKRVTKTVKGGRNMRFTALVVVGDGNGHVGAGLGKAVEIPEAIRKGKEDAMKHLVSISLDENGSVTHDFIGKYGSANVLLKKAPDGTGIIAGGPARVVCELAGIKNIRTKSLGSNNKQNVVLATIEGLRQVKSPEEVARNRGKSVDEIMA